MPVNNDSSHLLAESRRMIGKEIRELKKKESLGDEDLKKLQRLVAMLVDVATSEKKLTDEDLEKARGLSTDALRRAAKMRGPAPAE